MSNGDCQNDGCLIGDFPSDDFRNDGFLIDVKLLIHYGGFLNDFCYGKNWNFCLNVQLNKKFSSDNWTLSNLKFTFLKKIILKNCLIQKKNKNISYLERLRDFELLDPELLLPLLERLFDLEFLSDLLPERLRLRLRLLLWLFERDRDRDLKIYKKT